MKYSSIALVAIMFISGCTSVVAPTGLSVAMQADPTVVFSKSNTILHIDVDNRQNKAARNVLIEMFDAGLLRGQCRQFFDRLLPYEFQSIACRLDAPDVPETTQTEVNARVTFDSEFSADHVFEVMKESEYERRLASGAYEAAPTSAVYQDRNIAIEVQLSEAPPLVVRPGKQYFAYFTITNIGNGFVSRIEPGDFLVEHDNILDCPAITRLEPVGKTFPRLACEIKIDPTFFSVSGRPVDFRSTDFLVRLEYTYEVRDKLRINIIK